MKTLKTTNENSIMQNNIKQLLLKRGIKLIMPSAEQLEKMDMTLKRYNKIMLGDELNSRELITLSNFLQLDLKEMITIDE